MQTLLYRIRLLFTKAQEGTIFHIMNLQHIVTVARAADSAPLQTQLSSEVLPPDSGGLGADAMAICRTFESSLKLVSTQYKEELLLSHLKEMASYVTQAQGLLKAGRKAVELSAVLGNAIKCRVRCLASLWYACPGCHTLVPLHCPVSSTYSKIVKMKFHVHGRFVRTDGSLS
jgi:hypothetical protein